MEIGIERKDGVTTISPKGNIDYVTAPELDEAVERGLVVMLGEDMDRAYLDCVIGMRQRPDEALDKGIGVVYTPLNGAASIPVRRVMDALGYRNFHIVAEQRDPDPDFTTAPFPNPEDARAFELAEKGASGRAKALLVNGLYGAIDVVDESVAAIFREGELVKLPFALRERLMVRG